MNRAKKLLKVYLLLLIFIPFFVSANETTLVIGTKEAPPFSYKTQESKWEGVSIDLWREIAKKLNLKYQFKEYSLNELKDQVANKRVDIAIAAITVTANREKIADFSNGYYTANLAIAIPKDEGSVIKSFLDKLFSFTTLWIILGIIIIIHVAGFAFWLMERSEKDKDTTFFEGLKNGIWWATVTMTTVGYGDVTPKTLGGKVVATIWMFLSMFIIVLLIAAITSLFTLSHKKYFINEPADLPKGVVATIMGSYSHEYLKNKDINLVYYKSIKEALEAVKNRDVDAFVYDEPLLSYEINKDFKDSIKLTPARFQPQNYSIMLTQDSPLREQINRALLEIIESDKWQYIKSKYHLFP